MPPTQDFRLHTRRFEITWHLTPGAPGGRSCRPWLREEKQDCEAPLNHATRAYSLIIHPAHPPPSCGAIIPMVLHFSTDTRRTFGTTFTLAPRTRSLVRRRYGKLSRNRPISAYIFPVRRFFSPGAIFVAQISFNRRGHSKTRAKSGCTPLAR